jgi:PAS domain S-box-containing protein
MSIRAHLTVLVVTLLVPVLAFAVLAVARIHERERAATLTGLAARAEVIALRVEHQITETMHALHVLAGSPYLDRGALRAFYRDARRAHRAQEEWGTLVLTAPSGEKLLDLTQPLEAELPAVADELSLRQVVLSGQPVIGGLAFRSLLGEHGFAVRVPVIRDGAVAYVLSAIVPASVVAQRLAEAPLPPGWIAAVFDGNHVLVARSQAGERFLGATAGPALRQAVADRSEGRIEAPNLEGVETVTAFRRSLRSNWTVTIDVPAAVLEAPARASILAMAAGGLGVVAIGLLLGALVGRRVARPLRALARGAAALRRGEPFVFGGSIVSEAETVGQALMVAADARARVEAELRESEERVRRQFAELEAIYVSAPVGLAFVDPELRFVRVNRRLTQMHGLPVGAHLGRTIRELLPALADAVEPLYREVLATGRPRLDVEITVATPGSAGAERDWLLSLLPVGSPESGVAGVNVVVQDVTERKRVEQAARKSEARAHTLARLNAMISSSLDLADVLDAIAHAGGELMEAPAVGFWLLNTTEQVLELRGRWGDSMWFDLPSPTLPLGVGLVGTAAQRRTALIVDDVMADDRFIFREWARHHGLRSFLAAPIVAHDALVGVLALMRGAPFGPAAVEHPLLQIFVSEAATAIANAQLFEEAQRERREAEVARAEAERANQAKEQFLAVVSHELRNPLSAMLGWTRILTGARPGEPMFTRAVETIERNVRLQRQLINDLLDMSRITTGKLHVDLCPVDLADVVQAASENFRVTAEAKGLVFTTHLTGERPMTVLGDAGRLHQVVTNLLANAIKFTPADGSVTVGLERDGDRARITVADTGRGIAPELVARVFERFTQADSSTTRSHGGLGLGLTIVRHLVERHGGRVEAASAGMGCGATFTVSLPLATAGGGARRAARDGDHRSAAGSPTSSLAGRTLVVVDDDPDACDLLATLLERHGAKVVKAGSADEALQALRRDVPDALLTDIAMPENDGYQLLRWVRALGGPYASLPAVAVTAHPGPTTQQQVLTSGFDGYVPKPFEPEDLVGTVVYVITERAA